MDEITKALRKVQSLAREAEMAMQHGDLSGAYSAAERAQHAAFDAKALIQWKTDRIPETSR